MKKILILTAGLVMAACEKPIFDSEDTTAASGNVVFTFNATGAQTRATVPALSSAATRAATPTIADHFAKLNVMLFNDDGTKYFDKVRTQYASDENFGQMSLILPAGEYTIVAVGHSSAKSATIKSPELVQFTASDGQKLTDTFCYAGQVTVADTPEHHALTMSRVCAMLRFQFTDDEIPAQLASLKFDYTGGSANFNPTTSEGTTRSTQSETRPVSADDQYQVFTFRFDKLIKS